MTQYVRTNPSLRELQLTVNELLSGRSSNTGTVTLSIDTTATTVDNPIVHENSIVLLFPQTASAASELGAGGLYAVAGDGSFTATHSNSATADRTFGYVVVG